MKLRLAVLVLLVASPVVWPAHGQELKPICPDRPGRGTSPCTLEAGHSQIEIGLFDDSFTHRSGVNADSETIGSMLGKWARAPGLAPATTRPPAKRGWPGPASLRRLQSQHARTHIAGDLSVRHPAPAIGLFGNKGYGGAFRLFDEDMS